MRFGIKFLLVPEQSIGKAAALCLCKESSGPWRCPGDRADAEFWGFVAAYQGGSAGLRQLSEGVCVCSGTPVLALPQPLWGPGLLHLLGTGIKLSPLQEQLWVTELSPSSPSEWDWELRPLGFGPVPLKVWHKSGY